jgi:hypothetical protein
LIQRGLHFGGATSVGARWSHREVPAMDTQLSFGAVQAVYREIVEGVASRVVDVAH